MGQLKESYDLKSKMSQDEIRGYWEKTFQDELRKALTKSQDEEICHEEGEGTAGGE